MGTIELSNSGLNWGTVLAFFVAVGGGVAWVVRRIDRNRQRMERFVSDQVRSVASILDVKLEGISQHLSDQDARLADTRDRVIRLEGKLDSPRDG